MPKSSAEPPSSNVDKTVPPYDKDNGGLRSDGSEDSESSSCKSSSSSSTTSKKKNKVQLAIYDLSQGMAKALSTQLLGPEHAIDVVPHTGILVFGKEYFFGTGSGISVEDPDHFRSSRGIQPLEILDLGTTTISQDEFEAWCHEISSLQFDASKYNLFENNCNHFSQCVILEGLHLRGCGVPQWVLDVPQKFLATPFGQLARPMLENMQVSGGVPFTARTTPYMDLITDVTNTTCNGKTEDKTTAITNGADHEVHVTTTRTKILHGRQALESTSSDEDRVDPPKSKVRKVSHFNQETTKVNNRQ